MRLSNLLVRPSAGSLPLWAILVIKGGELIQNWQQQPQVDTEACVARAALNGQALVECQSLLEEAVAVSHEDEHPSSDDTGQQEQILTAVLPVVSGFLGVLIGSIRRCCPRRRTDGGREETFTPKKPLAIEAGGQRGPRRRGGGMVV